MAEICNASGSKCTAIALLHFCKVVRRSFQPLEQSQRRDCVRMLLRNFLVPLCSEFPIRCLTKIRVFVAAGRLVGASHWFLGMERKRHFQQPQPAGQCGAGSCLFAHPGGVDDFCDWLHGLCRRPQGELVSPRRGELELLSCELTSLSAFCSTVCHIPGHHSPPRDDCRHPRLYFQRLGKCSYLAIVNLFHSIYQEKYT
jgi:hypothetical protein